MQIAFSSYSMMTLYEYSKGWMEAQWNALPEETKEKYMEGYESKEEMHEEEMFSLFRFWMRFEWVQD